MRRQEWEQPDPTRLQKLQQLEKEEQKEEERIKRPIHINTFREQVRRQQRQFRQQNHQYLKMSGMMMRSSFDQNKFTSFSDKDRRAKNYTKGNTNNRNQPKLAPVVHIPLDGVEFNCALLQNKFPIRDVYQLLPFRKESVLFESHQYLSDEFMFFLFQQQSASAESLKYKLENTIEEGILNQFRSSINKVFKYVSFFDFIYFLNRRGNSRLDRQNRYPEFMLEIARLNPNYLLKMDDEQRKMFNREQIMVQEEQTCERVIECEQSDLMETSENLCFETMQEYSRYKSQKGIQFKHMKIYQKDAIINTNIRNIISTQKIYLVEIIEQVHSYIKLSQQCEGTTIMAKVFQHLINKADQYLRLLCGYTQSKILTTYNIQNYQQKIYSFIEKSIRYHKQVRQLPSYIFKQFPVLEIWYQIPENLLGYTRKQLHQTFYQLMEAIIVFQQKMRDSELYQALKMKQEGVKYLQ